MEICLQDDDGKLYSKLYVSSLDLDFAQYCIGVILKKRWHHKPWEKRGTIYLQQSAFTTALVIAYARPFTRSDGWPDFPAELKEFNIEEEKLHNRMIELRHKVYAHSDSENYSITPWRARGFSADIVGAPTCCIDAEEAVLLRQMISKLLLAIRGRKNQIVPAEQ